MMVKVHITFLWFPEQVIGISAFNFKETVNHLFNKKDSEQI